MIEFESVFLDTSPFIYLIENNPKYCSIIENFIAENIANETLFITSVITVSEFQVIPRRVNNFNPINDFEKLVNQLHFKIFDITFEIAEISAGLRAKYGFLKSIDTIQLAVAINHKCQCFLSNDLKLKKVQEIKIITLEDLQ